MNRKLQEHTQEPGRSPTGPRRARLGALGWILLCVLPAGWALADPRPEIPAGLKRLRAAYPKAVCRLAANKLIFCDGTFFPYDDGKPKTFQQKLRHPDLEDQLSLPYPAGPVFPVPPKTDPGRIRVTALFKKLYGATEHQVRKNLVAVSWLPARPPGRHRGRLPRVRFNRAQGAAQALKQVAADLARLPRKFRRLVRRRPSTFVWRKIKGTRRLSAHSFGIAIDLALPRMSYWRWDLFGPLHRLRYRKDVPMPIVCIFERHGFIWGGKWAHYDTMHFEYRPELLVHPDQAHPGRWLLPDPCRQSSRVPRPSSGL